MWPDSRGSSVAITAFYERGQLIASHSPLIRHYQAHRPVRLQNRSRKWFSWKALTTWLLIGAAGDRSSPTFLWERIPKIILGADIGNFTRAFLSKGGPGVVA